MPTTTVDHNDIRLQSIERVTREPNSQVNDGNRHRAGSLQANGHWFEADRELVQASSSRPDAGVATVG